MRVKHPDLAAGGAARRAEFDGLADDLLLMSIRPGKGNFFDPEYIGYGLMGAELIELAARERVVIYDRAPAHATLSRSPLALLPASFSGLRWVAASGCDPTGVPELDAHLRALAAHGRPALLSSWIDGEREGLRQGYLARLAAAGVVRGQCGPIAGTRWFLTNCGPVTAAAARLDAIAFGSGPVDLGQAALAGLASAIGVGRWRYRDGARRRLRQIERGEQIAAAGRDRLAATITGIVDATALAVRSSPS